MLKENTNSTYIVVKLITAQYFQMVVYNLTDFQQHGCYSLQP